MARPLLLLDDDARLLERIRKGEEQALVRLFEMNRVPIGAYVTRNNGTDDDAEDILQEAVVVLWERVRAGRFTHDAKLSTFLFAVAKHLWSRRLLRRKREIPGAPDPETVPDTGSSPLDDLIEGEAAARVQRGLAMIGEPCRQLLLLFYWEERSMDEIARTMGFANPDTAKAKKYQCKKALEEVIKRIP